MEEVAPMVQEAVKVIAVVKVEVALLEAAAQIEIVTMLMKETRLFLVKTC